MRRIGPQRTVAYSLPTKLLIQGGSQTEAGSLLQAVLGHSLVLVSRWLLVEVLSYVWNRERLG